MIKTNSSSVLAEALGAPLAPGFESLSQRQAKQLALALNSAQQRQRAALAASTEAALSHLPLLLRGAVRKVLIG